MKKSYLALDIGATKIAAALISGNKIINQTKIKTEAKKGGARILDNIKTAINQVGVKKVKGIGIGIAGQVDQKNGILVSSPNFSKSFKNIPLAKIIQTEFKKPVLVENDANCFTLGEAICGQAKGYDHVIGLTLGTGVGGGIVINQKIYHGRGGLAGELGHMAVIRDGFQCGCGQKGHLESYASGTAMVKIHRQLTGKTFSALAIEELAKKGDKDAKQVFKIMSQSLAIGLASIINIFNPDIIVLGGGLAKVKILIQPAIKLTKTKVLFPQLRDTKIVSTKPGGNSALLGASLLFKK